MREEVDGFVKWTSEKMATKLLDGSPMWAHATNPLYAQTEACLIVQDVVNPEAFVAGVAENDMRPTEVMVELLWGVPMHGVLVIDVTGAMILGEAQHVDTIEYILRTDGWAAYKWPKLRRSGKYWPRWYINAHS